MRKILFLLLVLSAPVTAIAQKTVKVDAEYTYVAPENVTVEQAKLTALDRAKIQAIADEFGTLVNQSNTTFVANQNGNSTVNFQSLGSSDVKGEWIETTEEPEYSVSYDQNMLVIHVKVSGRIREIQSTQIPLSVQVLCNGTTAQHERTEFKNGDDMFLAFQSPVKGYMLVYLIDYTAEKAYCLLPYSQSQDAAQIVEPDRKYLFFSPKDAPAEIRAQVDEYTLTSSTTAERNDLYVIFSPNEFVKANSTQTAELSPRELALADFNKWLSEIRKRDAKIQIVSKTITISK